jgi:hypothetical protein
MTPPIENSSNLGLAEPKTTFKDWVGLLWGFSVFLLVVIVLSFCMKPLFDFLDAPIGIKNNPVELTAGEQFARSAFAPILICCAFLTMLRSRLKKKAKPRP